MARQIPLGGSHAAVVDDEDFARVSEHKWSAFETGPGRVYATRTVGPRGRHKLIYMHRFVLGEPPSLLLEVDHVNGDYLDNRRRNLRWATHAQNAANRKPYEGRRFKGVCWTSREKKWRAYIKVDQRRRSLGYYATEEEAARAYDAAACEAWGEFARLNFPKGVADAG